jgi:hypothetical protein
MLRMGFSTLLLLGIYACSWVIPDYHMNKTIRKDLPSFVMVRLLPRGKTCATFKEPDGRQGVRAKLHVDFVRTPPRPLKLSISDNLFRDIPGDDDYTLEMKMGLGLHNIVVWDPSSSFRAYRSLYVIPCQYTGGKIPPALPDDLFFKEPY